MSRKLLSIAVLVAAFTLMLGTTETQARGRWTRGYSSRNNSVSVYSTRGYGNYGGSGYRGYGYRGGYGNYGYGPRVGAGVGNYGYGRGGVSVNVGGFF